MPDMPMRKDIIYVSAYIFAYIISALILVTVFHNPVEDILTGFFSFGLGFSAIAWLLTRNFENDSIRPAFRNEPILLVVLICWLLLYTTYGGSFIDSLLSSSFLQNEQLYVFVILIRKLFVFVLVPFLLYKLCGFSLKDFGLQIPFKEIFSKRNIYIFLVLSVIILLFQYFMSNGGKNFREANFSFTQMLIGFPLLFIWLFIEVGLIEEFFFRALLQSRFSVLLKSNAGGILMGCLIFGIAHAPGLYLRGFGETEGISEAMPFGFWVAYTICTMSVGGIFLGIIWNKTKNLYFVMGLHAMLDLIPNFADFIHTWKL